MNQFGMAQSARRVEDPRLLQGDGRYTDDITPPDMPATPERVWKALATAKAA